MFLQNGGPEKQYHFIDRSADAAIPWQESYAGSAAADYDNDGKLDLFFGTVYKGDRGKLFHNEGDWKFSDVPDAGGNQMRAPSRRRGPTTTTTGGPTSSPAGGSTGTWVKPGISCGLNGPIAPPTPGRSARWSS